MTDTPQDGVVRGHDLGERPDISVGGLEYEIEKRGRDRIPPSYVLHINAAGPTEDYQDHEFRRVLKVGSRSSLTDEVIEDALQKWREHRPDLTVLDFWVEEEHIARIGRPVHTVTEESVTQNTGVEQSGGGESQ